MTPQQTKLAIAAAMIAAVLGGTFALNQAAKDKEVASADASEQSGVDTRHNLINLSSHSGSGSGGGSDSDDTHIKRKHARDKNASGSASDLAAILDGATTAAVPIETEAETRERERYEKAQANKFKYRENDPDKVKPVEVGPVLSKVTEKYGLPKNVLAALMAAETGGTHRGGDHSIEAGYGVMNLRENNLVDTLGEGAALIGKTKEEVLYDQKLNIEAAGALLKSYYDDALASGLSESEALYTAISQYSGRPDPQLAGNLADETGALLFKGFELHLSDGGGDLVVPGTPNPPLPIKNLDLVGLERTDNGGIQVVPGTTPPNEQSYGSGSAAGGATVSP